MNTGPAGRLVVRHLGLAGYEPVWHAMQSFTDERDENTVDELWLGGRESGEELARTPSTRSVTHGVVISPDDRYAFVTSEGKRADPGAVDVLDLRSLKKVASVDVGLQAGGIAFWKID